MYPFIIKPKFKKIHVSGSENAISIKTKNEDVLIKIQDSKIDHIVHKDLNTNIEKSVFDPIKKLEIGEKTYQRNVSHYVLSGFNGKNQLRIGQTFHVGPGGTWSSLPHDFENYPEDNFEEFFFYLLNGGSGRAIQVGKGLWNDGTNVDSSWFVQDKTFSPIPMGYHPVVGEPNVNVSYIWAYLCLKEEWEKA